MPIPGQDLSRSEVTSESRKEEEKNREMNRVNIALPYLSSWKGSCKVTESKD